MREGGGEGGRECVSEAYWLSDGGSGMISRLTLLHTLSYTSL